MVAGFYFGIETPITTVACMNSEMKEPKTQSRYRIQFRGRVPPDISQRVSIIHAAAIATGHDQDTNDTGSADESSAAPIPLDDNTGKPHKS